MRGSDLPKIGEKARSVFHAPMTGFLKRRRCRLIHTGAMTWPFLSYLGGGQGVDVLPYLKLQLDVFEGGPGG
jgi:hypothetical protein